MAPPNAQRVLVEQGGSIAAPTILGQGPVRIPTGGKIRAGIKVLTRKAAEQPMKPPKHMECSMARSSKGRGMPRAQLECSLRKP
jgi:hypothetical protein